MNSSEWITIINFEGTNNYTIQHAKSVWFSDFFFVLNFSDSRNWYYTSEMMLSILRKCIFFWKIYSACINTLLSVSSYTITLFKFTYELNSKADIRDESKHFSEYILSYNLKNRLSLLYFCWFVDDKFRIIYPGSVQLVFTQSDD